MNLKKIAIVRTSALGDIVWCLPLLQNILNTYPQAAVTWFVDPSFAPLLRLFIADKGPRVQIRELKKPRSLKGYWTWRQAIRDTEYDLVLCTQTSLRLNALYPSFRSPRKIGVDSVRSSELHRFFVGEKIRPPTSSTSLHQQEIYLDFARAIGIDNPITHVTWQLPATGLSKAQAMLAPLGTGQKTGQQQYKTVAIAPFASHRERSWGTDKIISLIESMSQTHPQVKFVFVGSLNFPTEAKLLEDFASTHSSQVISALGKTTLAELACLIQQSDALFSPDSGPIHLADSLGVPAIGLYAAVPVWLTGPYHNQNHCLDKYLQAVKRFCPAWTQAQISRGQRVHHPQLMDLFGVEEVSNKILTSLNI
jgi:heptosyltransferase I